MPNKPYLFSLITHQKWKSLSKSLKSSKAAKLCAERDDSNLTCLAMALGYQAPVEIIQAIIDVDRSLLSERDMFGATSIHVACLNGTRCELINTLIRNEPSLTRERDYDQRAPLHHAVEYACQSGDSNKSYIDVVRTICQAAPEMVHYKDKAGETPIDLVQFTKAKYEESHQDYARLHSIYLILRDVSIKVYKANKIRWELEGHMQHLGITQETKVSGTSTSISQSTGSRSYSISCKTPASIKSDNMAGSELNIEAQDRDIEPSKIMEDVEKRAKKRKFLNFGTSKLSKAGGSSSNS
jgi:ankyrin repeat protein